MSPRHHPTEVVLAGYASGALADGPGLTVSAHLERCPVCRARVRLFEEVGGALLTDTPAVAMADNALALALAGIERPPPPLRAAASAPRPPGGVALPAALGRRSIGARRWLGPGLWVAPVRSNRPDGWRTYLLRAPPRLKVPRHDHNGPEFAAVLQGAFRDETGVYRPGDFAESGEGLEHHPRVEDDGPCLCLVSGHGGLRATGIWRLIQPLIGI